jgi:Uri superfamily endonuclease
VAYRHVIGANTSYALVIDLWHIDMLSEQTLTSYALVIELWHIDMLSEQTLTSYALVIELWHIDMLSEQTFIQLFLSRPSEIIKKTDNLFFHVTM